MTFPTKEKEKKNSSVQLSSFHCLQYCTEPRGEIGADAATTRQLQCCLSFQWSKTYRARYMRSCVQRGRALVSGEAIRRVPLPGRGSMIHTGCQVTRSREIQHTIIYLLPGCIISNSISVRH